MMPADPRGGPPQGRVVSTAVQSFKGYWEHNTPHWDLQASHAALFRLQRPDQDLTVRAGSRRGPQGNLKESSGHQVPDQNDAGRSTHRTWLE